MSIYKEYRNKLMLLTTFTLKTLAGCQNMDTFQKSTYVKTFSYLLVLMETTIFSTTVDILVYKNSITSTAVT